MIEGLVSIVIPCYNHGEYLMQSVQSALNQTFPNIEVIVINDGSNDPFTVKILKELDSVNVTVIHQVNKGLPAARNTGIQQAKGEFILPLDSDDFLEPTFVEQALQVIKTEIDVVAVSSDVRRLGALNDFQKMKGGVIADFVASCNVYPAALYQKSLWANIGGYDEKMTLGYEDWEFWIRALSSGGKIYIIDQPLFNYRVKVESMVVNSNRKRLEIMTYIIEKNAAIYKDYAVEAILGREKLLDELRFNYEKNLISVYNGLSYKLGRFFLYPIKVIFSLFR